jgi:hypothetical protein
MCLVRTRTIGILVAASLIVSVSAGRADVTYSYTGNPFTTFSESGGGNPSGFAGGFVSVIHGYFAFTRQLRRRGQPEPVFLLGRSFSDDCND